MNYNIAQPLQEISRDYPHKLALIHGSRSFTFAELDRLSRAYAFALAVQGVKRGDRVMLMVRPSIEFISLTFALFKLGAPVILIDPGMGYKNLLGCVGSVKPQVFIGIPMAHIFKTFFPRHFDTVQLNICVGSSFGLFGKSLQSITDPAEHSFPAVHSEKTDLAAIIFTTGSTGPPKGVRYEHGVFLAQLGLIRDYYGITLDDIDQPAFPLFALFSAALGACSVIPDMNPARPAQVNPEKFIRTIIKHNVTYSFGSPAIWNVVSGYCIKNSIRLPSLKKILMAGAPVSGELIGRVKRIVSADAEIHTPYGATESLPIVSMTGSEILSGTWPQTMKGKGTCVGRPLPGNDIRILPISDDAIVAWDDDTVLSADSIGEIVVKGEVVTREYDNNPRENALAKIRDGDTFWHRLGDTGYMDNEGRLWFCGRKAHRVITRTETMFTICCEAIFNNHPQVYRSALVGVGEWGNQTPVLIVEPHEKIANRAAFFTELLGLANQYDITRPIRNFLIHPSFPVDIRHNAKIFREKLAVWAADKIVMSDE
ncbi:MAG: AMP-binding protein [Proteobacteria bacterium]|nr:AMP-binding protein [Pseudomonadota bacterium]MBU1710507.1 AMP-binding protein [Pseudomonadota bacterium]